MWQWELPLIYSEGAVPCVRAHHCNSFHALPLLCALTQVAMIAASCTPPAPVLILSWSVVVVVGVACCLQRTVRGTEMQLQPPPPSTSSGSALALVECTMQQSICVRAGQGSVPLSMPYMMQFCCIQLLYATKLHRVMACFTQVAMIAALCTPPVPVLILSWSVVAVVGVASQFL